MFILKHRTETALLLLISVFAGIFLSFYIHKTKPQFNFPPNNPVAVIMPESVPNPIFNQAPLSKFIPQIATAEEISSDGTKKLIMTSTSNQDGTSTVTLYSEDKTDENSHHIFTNRLESWESISLPFNTWSPDNKYFFIQLDSPENTIIRVFNSAGEPFDNNEEYLDLTETFISSNTGNTFRHATGWGGYSVIILNTTKSDGEQGPSYWFESPTKTVTQLSTLFL